MNWYCMLNLFWIQTDHSLTNVVAASSCGLLEVLRIQGNQGVQNLICSEFQHHLSKLSSCSCCSVYTSVNLKKYLLGWFFYSLCRYMLLVFLNKFCHWLLTFVEPRYWSTVWSSQLHLLAEIRMAAHKLHEQNQFKKTNLKTSQIRSDLPLLFSDFFFNLQ